MSKSPRTARRAARSGPPRDVESLRAAISSARLSGTPPQVVEQARGLLMAWLGTVRTEPFTGIVRDLASGSAARQVGQAMVDQSPAPEGLDCKAGCAFCCILPGDDGGTITGAEARALHAVLTPLAGQPDGRAWHTHACPALDPETRLCRAYDARPMICRTYVSRDVTACEAIAEGDAKPGTGTLPAQIIHIAVQSLARAALKGVTTVPTYSLKKVATAALGLAEVESALKSSRHPPGSLDTERRRLSRGIFRAH
ncbi:Putative zinc-or iron-chelating domain-containing protein [Jannaschia faecimaris]|uniref:Putative zinc-or iron-chelating domain-containing protein n=1 Tax=Jannaschia faecimaris TaxID=1244108 RepID=A0A1H3U3R7_9RHOB|nr:YkgJ family cysteine cluster protein [Jannaschia faecimaris]SDZ56721.1 Putative zinc-or iron-chelating domain-containing protein [Jannaschia faecimaris]